VPFWCWLCSVLASIKAWLETAFYDFEDNPKLMMMLVTFIDTDVEPLKEFAVFSGMMKRIIQRSTEKIRPLDANTFGSASVHSHAIKRKRIVDFDAANISAQITLISWKQIQFLRADGQF
jgi:hypothetical protein